MCGICGIINLKGGQIPDVLEKMNEFLHHRGPDDRGVKKMGPVGMAMSRLAIIDLNTGHQPMTSVDGRYVIVYNGEIYNFIELRERFFEAGFFRSKSDTEVILNIFKKFGSDCLQYLNGMFAFAIWDSVEKRMFIARDRLGIKPLYYYLDDSYFVFASEIKAFYAVPGLDFTIDYRFYNDYFAHGYVPQPYTVFKRISKLEPGSFLTIGNGQVERKIYWSANELSLKNEVSERALENVKDLLAESVQKQLISDVPLGIFLSGGLDSSIIAYEMNRQKEKRSSFTIGFRHASNEGDVFCARQVASWLEMEHHESILEPAQIQDLDPVLNSLDEPFAVSSMLPIYWNSLQARRHVKVVLSGDGADEVFAGYSRYRKISGLWRWAKNGWLPLLNGARLLDLMLTIIPGELVGKYRSLRVQPLIHFLNENDAAGQYLSFLSASRKADRMKMVSPEIAAQYRQLLYSERFFEYFNTNDPLSVTNRLLAFDLNTSLVDEMLSKVDKASMLASIEVRVPFLDHRLVEAAFHIPFNAKIINNGKSTLKSIYDEILPKTIIQAKKRGFNLPMNRWIRNFWHHRFQDAFNSRDADAAGLNSFFLKNDLKNYLNEKSRADGMKFFNAYCLIRWYQNHQRCVRAN